MEGNTWKKLWKNRERDVLSALLVTFITFHLPDRRTEGIIPTLLEKGIMQALLSLLSEPCFRLKRIPIRPFGPTTEHPLVKGSSTGKGVWPSAYAHPPLVARGNSLRREQGEQKLREICLYIPGLYQTASIKAVNPYQ
jgi:hypothetical protein